MPVLELWLRYDRAKRGKDCVRGYADRDEKILIGKVLNHEVTRGLMISNDAMLVRLSSWSTSYSPIREGGTIIFRQFVP